jgi:hypothetical protein
MRHYLLRERKIGKRLRADVVLAEKANQLYRDSGYTDLITFEEDIARISALVLVIAESAGSLAELGAFGANPTIRNSLAVLMQDKYANEESFVRFGPVQRIKNDDPARVGFFPWRTNGKSHVVKGSARSLVRDITTFINNWIDKTPSAPLYRNIEDIQIFFILYWIIYLSTAVSLQKLTDLYGSIMPPVDSSVIKSKLYCMKLAGWIGSFMYSSVEYYHTHSDVDPFKYYFKPGVLDNNGTRRRLDVTTALKDSLSIPRNVRKRVFDLRKVTVK